MDLGRWSFRRVGRFFGDVLDGEIEIGSDASETDFVRDAFDVSHDTEELDRALALIRPGSGAEKILQTFAPYFEGGLMLKIVEGETRLTNLFLFGQLFTPPDSKGTAIDLGIGRMESTHVYRGSIEPVLKALKLNVFFRLEGATAFAFAVSRDTIFILFDHRPHPWQVLAIENAYLSARQAFALKAVK